MKLDRIDIILIGVLILALWAILPIQLSLIPTINVGWESKAVKSINDAFLNLSYSYIAALIFYGLTTRLPAYRRKKKLMPVIQKRVDQIGAKGLYYIILEFSRESGCKAEYKNSDNTAKILASKQLFDEMSFFKRVYGVRKTYLEHVRDEGMKIREMVSCLINRYKDEMTAEQILLLEDIPDMYVFRVVDLLLSCHPAKNDKGSKELFVEEFCKLHEKYLEVEKIFGINN